MGQFDFSTGVTPNWQFNGTLTVGSDGAGHDVTLYGDTAGSRLVWDADNDILQLIVSKMTQTWTTTAATAGEQGFKITTTDSVAQSAGIIQSLLVDHNISGAKTSSAQVEAISVDMNIGANVTYAYPFASYVSKTGNPNIGLVAGHSIYLEDMGGGTLGSIIGLDIGINSANVGSGRHTGIRIRNHSGTAKSAILIEEAFTDTILRHSPSGVDLNLITLDNASGGIFYWDDSEQHFRFTPGVMAEDIEVEELGSATYDDLQDLINTTLSAGRTSGGAIEASGGSGDIKVNLGTGFVKTTDSAIGATPSFNWSDTVISAGASAGDILDETVNYIYLDYNAGSPVPKATDDRTAIELNRMFTLGRVFRSGTTLHIINSGLKLYNHTRDNHERLIQVRGFERAQGGVVAEKLIRYLTATAGVYFLGAGKITNDQQDTSGNGHTLTRWYHTGGAWVSNTSTEGASAAGQISNEHYDNGTNIADIGTARYGVFWVFIHFDGDLQVVYGRGSYKLAAAENATVPTLPDAVSQFSILAAKIIVAQGDTNFTSIVPAYETLFPVSSPPNHWDLGGLQGGTADEYYHLTSSEHTELNAWLDDVTLSNGGGVDLGSGGLTTTGTLDISSGTLTLANDQISGDKIEGGTIAATTITTLTTGAGNAVFNSWGAVFGDDYYLYMQSDYSSYVAGLDSGYLDLGANSGVRFRVGAHGMVLAIDGQLISTPYTLRITGTLDMGQGTGTMILPVFSDPVTQPSEGTFWYNTTKDMLEYATASGMEVVVTRGATQTLTNKTLGAVTLIGKLTAGANEIEGSSFDINGGDITGTTWQTHTLTLSGNFIRSGAHSLTLITTATTELTLPTSGTLVNSTHTHALTAGATDVTATYTELNIMDDATLTTAELNLMDLSAQSVIAGELLVGTGSGTAAWQKTGVILSAPDISGTVSAASALTLPAFTLGGTMTLGAAQIFDMGASYCRFTSTGGGTGIQIIVTNDGTSGAALNLIQNSADPAANDNISHIYSRGESSTSVQRIYSDIITTIVDTTNESEDGKIEFWTMRAGTLTLGGYVDQNGALWIDGSITLDANETVDGVDVSAHAANTTTAHGAVSAATASKIVVRDASARAKFAAPNAAGDALIKGTPITSGEFPAVTDEYYLVGTGTSMEERAVPEAGLSESDVATYTHSESEVASDNLRNSNDGEKSTQSTTYVKLKEVSLGADLDNCRLKFDLKGSVAASAQYGRVYKNGVAHGTEQVGYSETYATKSEDLSGWSSGDLLQIYGHATTGVPARTIWVRNMRFYYDADDTDTITHIISKELETPIALVEEERDPTISITNQDP